ncbi:MAG: nucleoside hydrolase-like domain-containing protein [Isosphaeraceae bacterium]
MLTLLAGLTLSAAAPANDRPRVVVLTDVSSLTAGMAEPDDGQSLIRLSLYLNELDVEGLVATSNLGHGRRVRPDLIARVIDAYDQVRPNLVRHDPRYPPADRLRSLIHAGGPEAGPKMPVGDCVGPGKDTDGSRAITAAADRRDPRPLWVLVWGGSADLAQALDSARRTRSPDDFRRFVSRFQVHSIGDQDSTGPWIKREFPDLDVITQERAYRGMYRGGDRSLVSSEWVRTHARGHGALGDLYPDYDGGDIFGRTLGPVRGVKEGDTPSFLSLVPNGLNDPERPWLGGWGGRFRVVDHRGVDVPDPGMGRPEDPDPRLATVYRWRSAFQADFQARLDWCVRPPAEANHPPVPRIAGNVDREARSGETITMDASGSTDPDGDELVFSWDVYPRDAPISLKIEGNDQPLARATMPAVDRPTVIPILLSVTDRGDPSLTRYARLALRVVPGP